MLRFLSQLLLLLILLTLTLETGWAKKNTSSIYSKKMKLNKPFQYYKVMGDRFRNLKDFTKSIKYYEYALAVNSDCAECYLNLGRIKYDKQLYVDAIKELEIAITKSFTYPFDRMKSYYLLALIYFKINRDGKAVEILSQLIFEHQEIMNKGYLKNFIDPKHYTPAYLLTGLYYRNNDLLDESYKGPEIKKYKDKTTPNMDEKDLNYIFGKNTLYFLISIDLNYRKDFCNYFLYEYYKSKNQFDNAFRYLNQALTINPNIQTEITGATWIKDYMILDDIES